MTTTSHGMERIKYLIELLRLCWLTLLAIGSGTLGVFLSEFDPVRSALGALGCLAVSALIVATIRIDSRIRSLLKEVERQ